ncbi:MAG: hypothetical protein BWZ10_00289 [candidate division BRC1 bacterium ADurb.BinA364]|nr:MAG: hypothetical protein BWZ10_00289 [candidate division BRC1 bacterium ADurb.BinA364]
MHEAIADKNALSLVGRNADGAASVQFAIDDSRIYRIDDANNGSMAFVILHRLDVAKEEILHQDIIAIANGQDIRVGVGDEDAGAGAACQRQIPAIGDRQSLGQSKFAKRDFDGGSVAGFVDHRLQVEVHFRRFGPCGLRGIGRFIGAEQRKAGQQGPKRKRPSGQSSQGRVAPGAAVHGLAPSNSGIIRMRGARLRDAAASEQGSEDAESG